MGEYKLGIDIGGTFIKYGIIDKDFNIIDKWKVKSIRFESKDDFYDYLCENMGELNKVDYIGISAPGLIDKHSNVKSYAAPNVCVMYGTNINKEVSSRTGKKVFSINDAKSAGLCELKLGNAKGSVSSAFLILGTGTGGCVCNEKGVVYGKDAFAGEFHHLPFMNLKTNKIDRLGEYSSITALLRLYNSKVDRNNKVELGIEVCNKYNDGDNIAEKVMQEWIDNIVISLITIVTFYNPEIICIGGGISEEGWFINLVNEKFKLACEEYLGADIITTEIKGCKYNNDANILGSIININN
ncbi:MAG: ROK family protein [Clostridium sp.]|uniref:ROK family protein n=1 Tax=Clostridium sp. TaxID=1506 RepID=UPI0029149203|nr:ROK family protein [Clostridium sp.]MDU5108912.1 ROK family protein [Clostridium sp.]